MANPISYIKVHPGIGLARVGNSPDYFIGPEAPGIVPSPTPPGQPTSNDYKDSNGLLKPQAARFRVYGYDADNNVVQEITSSDGSLEWSVNVQNRKAFNYNFQGQYGFDPTSLRNPNITDANTRQSALIISQGGNQSAATVEGANATPVTVEGPIFDGLDSGQLPGYFDYDDDFGGNPPTPYDMVDVTYASKDVQLATLRTDDDGRLVFVGGTGDAASLTTPPIKISKVPPDAFAYNFQQPSDGIDNAVGQPGVGDYDGTLYYAAQDASGNVYLWQAEVETSVFPNANYTLTNEVVLGTDGIAPLVGEGTVNPNAPACSIASFTPPDSSSPLFIFAYNTSDGSIRLGSTTDPTNAASYTWITLPTPASQGGFYTGVDLASFQGKLYIATNHRFGNIQPQASTLDIASSDDVTDPSSFVFNGKGIPQKGSVSGPALTVAGGQLYYLYQTPEIEIGVSSNGTNFDFRTLDFTGNLSLGAAPLGGKLYVASGLREQGNIPALAAIDDLGQASAFQEVGSSTYPGSTISPPAAGGVRLIAFGDQLLFAVIDTNGKTFLATSFPGDGNTYFNNPGWYDDTCGGQVDVTVTLNAGGTFSTEDTSGPSPAEKRGWVAVAPPNYAPEINNVVSLLDLQLNLFPAQDPYTGKGPIVYGISSAGDLYLSENGASFSTSPAPAGTGGSVAAPALAFMDGDLAYAGLDSGSHPYISSGPVGSLPAVADASPDSSFTATQNDSPGLAVFNGRLFYSVIDGGAAPMIASSSNAAAGSFDFAAAQGSSPISGTHGTALAAFNGQLFYAVIDGSNLPRLASSADGSPGSFSFQPVGTGTVTPSSVPPALAVFNSALYYGYRGTDGNIYLASSQAPFKSSPQVPPNTSAFNYSPLTFTPVAGAPSGARGISLTVFNGKLYLAATESDGAAVYATSEDGVTFTPFSPVSGGPGSNYAPALATDEPVSFYRDIYPILRTVTDYAWTNLPAFNGHGPGSMGDFLRRPFLDLLNDPSLQPGSQSGEDGPSARAFVYKFIRPTEILVPPTGGSSPYNPPVPPAAIGNPPTAVDPPRGSLMPHLYGNGGSPEENQVNGTQFPNQWLTLTPHQLSKFQRWVNGDFVQGTEPFPQPLDQLPVAVQPAALDFAALEPTVGGGFHPGIELTYMMGQGPWFAGPFRIAADLVTGGAIEPGDVAGYMSVPWQGDFWSCNTSWWPAIRPDIIVDQRPATGGAPNLIPLAWFRGQGIPPKADSIPGYQEGYNLMVTDWYRFGLVTADQGVIIEGQQAYREVERDPTLNRDPEDS